MIAPPCVLVDGIGNMCQTFVAKIDTSTQIYCQQFKEILVIEGCYPSAYATVTIDLSPEAGLYIVLTTSKPREFKSFTKKLKDAIVAKEPAIKVEWVRMLSVRLQRLFGWGDVSATTDDVRAACDQHNFPEVMALVPGAALLPVQGDLTMFPRLFEALRVGLPAVEDCAHEFNDHGPGPCATDPTHQRPFRKCGSCDMQLCLRCVRDTDTAEDERDLRRALHDIQGTHVWEE